MPKAGSPTDWSIPLEERRPSNIVAPWAGRGCTVGYRASAGEKRATIEANTPTKRAPNLSTKTPIETAPIETALSREFLLGNTLLRGLTGIDQEAILESGSLVLLKTRQKVYEADREIDEVLFPISSVPSVVAELENGDMIEVGTVGCDGVSAITLLLGSTTSANESYCQVPGMAISISPRLFDQLQHGNPEFRKLLDRYLQAYINLLGQLAACNRLHSVYERCARWILMTHDRVKADVLPLTHEYLGMMLGSRRSGVTIALATLRAAAFVTSAQGKITVLDRSGLEDASCECYAVAQTQFAGILR